MSAADDITLAMLTQLAGEPIEHRQHASGHHRFRAAGDPTASPNRLLWEERALGGWYRDRESAALDLAHRLGQAVGRAEAVPVARITGKVERVIVDAIDALTEAGMPATEDAILDAAVRRLPLAEGQRDRRREAVRRAFKGTETRHILVAAGTDAATRVWEVAPGVKR